jgi:hypothetical protein
LIGAKYAKNFQDEIKKCAIVGIEEYKTKLKHIGPTKRIKTSKNTSKLIK